MEGKLDLPSNLLFREGKFATGRSRPGCTCSKQRSSGSTPWCQTGDGVGWKIDSFEQIPRQLDQRLPGTEPVPSISRASQGRRADLNFLERKAADITCSSVETFGFLPRRISIFSVYIKIFSMVDHVSIYLSIFEYFWVFRNNYEYYQVFLHILHISYRCTNCCKLFWYLPVAFWYIRDAASLI
jgi:hypothetical protein